MDLNKAMLIGRLTSDPQMRSTQNGQNVSSFSIATNRRWNDRATGQQREDTQFHNIVAWGKLAEICSQYLKKGAQIYVEGRLQTQSWDDAQSGQKKYRTEINAENMIMLGSKGQSTGGNFQQSQSAPQNNAAAPQNNDIPAAEEIPTINVDDQGNKDDDIKIEDIPF
jgi:single-strand DNA-binding protein